MKMNMKKLMSICAMSLAIASCTSITTFAAENSAGSRKEAVSNIATNFYKGEKVINNVNITIDTPVKDYATDKLIKEIEALKIADFDVKLGLKENFENIKANQDELTTDKNLQKLKGFINKKLDEFINSSDLSETVKEYINVDKYGVLTTGKNMNGKTTVSLHDKSGKILLQVNSDEVKEAKDKFTGIDSWGKLNDTIKKYFGINLN